MTESLPLGNDLQPVAVGIGDEINAHGRIFKADTAHLLVQLVGRFVVIRLEGQVEFAFSQIISLGMLFQPGQLQLKAAFPIAHVDNDKAVPIDAAFFVKSQGLFM